MLYGCGLVGIIECGKCVIDQHLKKKVLKERKMENKILYKRKSLLIDGLYRRRMGREGDQPNNCEWVLNSECKFHI